MYTPNSKNDVEAFFDTSIVSGELSKYQVMGPASKIISLKVALSDVIIFFIGLINNNKFSIHDLKATPGYIIVSLQNPVLRNFLRDFVLIQNNPTNNPILFREKAIEILSNIHVVDFFDRLITSEKFLPQNLIKISVETLSLLQDESVRKFLLLNIFGLNQWNANQLTELEAQALKYFHVRELLQPLIDSKKFDIKNLLLSNFRILENYSCFFFFKELIDSNKFDPNNLIYFGLSILTIFIFAEVKNFIKPLIESDQLDANKLINIRSHAIEALKDMKIRTYLKKLVDDKKFNPNTLLSEEINEFTFELLQNPELSVFIKNLIESNKFNLNNITYVNLTTIKTLKNKSARTFINDLIECTDLNINELIQNRFAMMAIDDSEVRIFLNHIINSSSFSARNISKINQYLQIALQKPLVRAFLNELITAGKFPPTKLLSINLNTLAALSDKNIRVFFKALLHKEKLTVDTILKLQEHHIWVLRTGKVRRFLKKNMEAGIISGEQFASLNIISINIFEFTRKIDELTIKINDSPSTFSFDDLKAGHYREGLPLKLTKATEAQKFYNNARIFYPTKKTETNPTSGAGRYETKGYD